MIVARAPLHRPMHRPRARRDMRVGLTAPRVDPRLHSLHTCHLTFVACATGTARAWPRVGLCSSPSTAHDLRASSAPAPRDRAARPRRVLGSFLARGSHASWSYWQLARGARGRKTKPPAGVGLFHPRNLNLPLATLSDSRLPEGLSMACAVM